MSARLIKVSLVVFMMHLLAFSVIWVGFPVPVSKGSAEYIFVAGDVESGQGDAFLSPSTTKDFNFDHFDASSFEPWIKLRSLKK